MGTLTLTLLIGASILLVAKFFPGTSNNDSDKPPSDQDSTSDSISTVASGKRPALTVVIVLTAVWALLSLATTYPFVFLVALLILAVGVYLAYRVLHPGSNFPTLSRKLFYDLRPLAIKVRDDFWTSFVLLRAWQRERAARIEREPAAEQERQAPNPFGEFKPIYKLGENRKKRSTHESDDSPFWGIVILIAIVLGAVIPLSALNGDPVAEELAEEKEEALEAKKAPIEKALLEKIDLDEAERYEYVHQFNGPSDSSIDDKELEIEAEIAVGEDHDFDCSYVTDEENYKVTVTCYKMGFFESLMN